MLRRPSRAPVTSGLSGPYRLSYSDINDIVALQLPGVFALGYEDNDKCFRISHIGRCDTDVRAKLCDFIGTAQMFKFDYCMSAKAAFERECQLFHDFKPPCTRIHPDRQRGTNWSCPRCAMFVPLP